jgi:hypothetical protein
MRLILPAALMLASCSQQPAADVLKPGVYFGGGRDALCVMGESAPQRFAFVAFAEKGDTNCAAEGRIERTATGWQLIPIGEGGCRLPLISEGDTIRLGKVPSDCAYYCGPNARIAGLRFAWRDTSAMLLADNPFGHGSVC